jgi:hypothetical protein
MVEARYIAIDLNVTDFKHSAWDKAKPVLLDHYWSGEPAPKDRHAEARILWSKEALHVRFSFEFEAAPTGELLDVAIHWSPEKHESDWDFQSHMTTASRVEKDLVTIAMRIPWNHWIHKPERAERWRTNLFRCVGKDPNRGYLAWQPTRTPEPNFHVPQVFGWLRFN